MGSSFKSTFPLISLAPKIVRPTNSSYHALVAQCIYTTKMMVKTILDLVDVLKDENNTK
jgi:hypothetical protein